jgi:hypothetical protein
MTISFEAFLRELAQCLQIDWTQPFVPTEKDGLIWPMSLAVRQYYWLMSKAWDQWWFCVIQEHLLNEPKPKNFNAKLNEIHLIYSKRPETDEEWSVPNSDIGIYLMHSARILQQMTRLSSLKWNWTLMFDQDQDDSWRYLQILRDQLLEFGIFPIEIIRQIVFLVSLDASFFCYGVAGEIGPTSTDHELQLRSLRTNK